MIELKNQFFINLFFKISQKKNFFLNIIIFLAIIDINKKVIIKNNLI